MEKAVEEEKGSKSRGGERSHHTLSIFSWKKSARSCAEREAEAEEGANLRSESQVTNRQLEQRTWDSIKMEKQSCLARMIAELK